MNYFSLKKQKGATKMKRGFTLIELLIVIAVMAILIGIALPHFKGMQDEGNVAKVKGELRTLKIAIESYCIHNAGSYPTYSTSWQNTMLVNASPSIISAALLDPFSPTSPKAEYQLEYSVNGEYYAIYSVGTSGTESVTALGDTGDVTESGITCIYVSNGEIDDHP